MPATKIDKIEWLEKGIDLFSISGIKGINVEHMAKVLNCNKSSFYWHFKSKDNFVDEMIHHWFSNSTNPIIEKLNKIQDPQFRFKKFITISFQDRSMKDFMFFFRQMAKSSPTGSVLLAELTQKRLMFTAALIEDLGYKANEAKLKAEVLLNFYIGWYERNKYHKSKEQEIDQVLQQIKSFINFYS